MKTGGMFGENYMSFLNPFQTLLKGVCYTADHNCMFHLFNIGHFQNCQIPRAITNHNR